MVRWVSNSVRRLNTGYYNYLILFLVILFAFRPYDKGIAYLAIWKTVFTITLFTALFNCKHRYKVKIIAAVFAVPTFVFSWLELAYTSEVTFILNVVFTLGFLWVCTASILYDVIMNAKVTLETLKGVVCAYFMFAFFFAYLYYLIEFLLPGSFNLLVRDVSFVTYSRNLSQMMYFSFITLLTIGFGDITPLRDIAQSCVIMEGIVGQFYVAILVARIVSVYSMYAIYADRKFFARMKKTHSGKK